ncbi:MAG: hypothetical protein K0S74_1238 [Chlamydiales bacterium]|jgi:hypothetical protein|nr:hypothetical protein [Chlamydiales bacterium]
MYYPDFYLKFTQNNKYFKIPQFQSETNATNNLSSAGKDIIKEIFKYYKFEEALPCRLVCKQWKQIADNVIQERLETGIDEAIDFLKQDEAKVAIDKEIYSQLEKALTTLRKSSEKENLSLKNILESLNSIFFNGEIKNVSQRQEIIKILRENISTNASNFIFMNALMKLSLKKDASIIDLYDNVTKLRGEYLDLNETDTELEAQLIKRAKCELYSRATVALALLLLGSITSYILNLELSKTHESYPAVPITISSIAVLAIILFGCASHKQLPSIWRNYRSQLIFKRKISQDDSNV